MSMLPSLGNSAIVIIHTLGIYIAVIAFTRVAGLRSFSKMSSFDFAMTVAVGSIVGTAATNADKPLGLAIVGLAAVYVLQMSVSAARRFDWVKGLVDNEPMLLVHEGDILEENLEHSDVSRGDLRAKLREANALGVEEVEAVVFETTGDISVLHSDDPDADVDAWILEDVRSPAQSSSRDNAP